MRTGDKTGRGEGKEEGRSRIGRTTKPEMGAATVHVERVVVGVLNSAKQHVIRVLHELRCGWPIHRI